mmetsp:Transcript_27826/g.52441  ORF Transcript_27826/g.52441 Transcript_27826/m.52441 type:complete len:139 (-) Transcript_27826:301-717(-)|eukprot:CAMPEP_0201630062 /NCGR_PEP_ID=MMETSP0493-20130528/4508_1 /ASSEMBLY_ACC=CAM_ASM_000838 /TAXON_ID=420259 /ORGANISM="Thalassiosira gravida, Strain GMp14c1" /LENGTH=138 /DNA_ID=CAMNT_0048101145 /DNA_START=8 /DNA_END=421 /DNA_ORIENTATION=+
METISIITPNESLASGISQPQRPTLQRADGQRFANCKHLEENEEHIVDDVEENNGQVESNNNNNNNNDDDKLKQTKFSEEESAVLKCGFWHGFCAENDNGMTTQTIVSKTKKKIFMYVDESKEEKDVLKSEFWGQHSW